MNDKNYYDKITSIIENIEVKNKASSMQEEQAKVTAYWNIGRLIVEAQGGEARAKYGDELIKKWSKSLMIDYGKGYNISNLKRFRKFYLSFSKGAARGKLSWTHYKSILPIKNENERNYYINQVILNNLSVRKLQDMIKNNDFDKLSATEKDNIKLIDNDEENLRVLNSINDYDVDTEDYYYQEIKAIIEDLEINHYVRAMQTETERVKAYWEIGKLIVEAQGGKEKAKYGSQLIKKWGKKLESIYGKKYGKSNLYYMRQFYIIFPEGATRSQLSWTHYKSILPIKNENERNYYINLVILNKLSTRELQEEIKNKAFDRLSYADKENIKLVNDGYNPSIKDLIKDPILINSKRRIDELDEKALHRYIISMLEYGFLELGLGYALYGHEYKIRIDKHCYKLDLLFFNVKFNCFVVVEIKLKCATVKDCNQVDFYVKLVDNYVKENYNNKTIGLLVVKEYDEFVVKYATNNNVLMTKYKLKTS